MVGNACLNLSTYHKNDSDATTCTGIDLLTGEDCAGAGRGKIGLRRFIAWKKGLDDTRLWIVGRQSTVSDGGSRQKHT